MIITLFSASFKSSRSYAVTPGCIFHADLHAGRFRVIGFLLERLHNIHDVQIFYSTMSETNEGSQVQSAELLMYAASEVNNTYHRIVGALKEFLDTGELPELAPVLPGSMGVVKGRKKREKGKRKPTAFNNFVKEKIHELRDQGDTEDDRSNNGTQPKALCPCCLLQGSQQQRTLNVTYFTADLFARAVAEWGKLSPEEKKLYTDHYKVIRLCTCGSYWTHTVQP